MIPRQYTKKKIIKIYSGIQSIWQQKIDLIFGANYERVWKILVQITQVLFLYFGSILVRIDYNQPHKYVQQCDAEQRRRG